MQGTLSQSNCSQNLKVIRSARVAAIVGMVLPAVIFSTLLHFVPATSEAKKASSRIRAGTRPSGKSAPSSKTVAANPRAFVDDRVIRILRDLKGRAPRPRSADPVSVTLPMWATKSQWLQAVYARHLVDTSNSTGLLSDKLLFYEVIKRELGSNADKYVVKTVGLRSFLVAEGLIDSEGRLVADGDKIDASLFKSFQAGFVARPAVGVAARETGRGLFADTDAFVAELLKNDSFLYRPDHRKRPVRSTVLDAVASGEAIVLQEDLLAKASAKNGAAKSAWREVRVHTYESRVVSDANPNFWVREGRASKDETARAQKFVTEFLSLLPGTLLSRQALSFDVLMLADGEMKIVDLVTNRGRKIAWSGYLDQPRVLGAYTRHFEAYAGMKFAGIGGFLLRKNVGNYFAYWGLRIEKSRPGFEKALAWIPPWP